MHRKLKIMIARWLAHRIDKRTRRLRRSVRDFNRSQWQRIHAADRRVRGLRLYAAWSSVETATTDYGRIVRLEPSSDAEQHTNIKAA